MSMAVKGMFSTEQPIINKIQDRANHAVRAVDENVGGENRNINEDENKKLPNNVNCSLAFVIESLFAVRAKLFMQYKGSKQ